MEKPRPATLAWLALGTGVAAYDVLCPQGETMSEGVDRALERPYGKLVAMGAIALTASHLCNLIPDKYDPFARVLSFKERAGEFVDEAMDCWGDE